MTEQTMTPDEVLDELVQAAKEFAKCVYPTGPLTTDVLMAQSKWRDARDRLREARTAAAALIAERDDAIRARDIARAMASDLMRSNAALEADAARGRWLVKQAHQKTAYDIYGNGAHWFIGIHSDDQRMSLTEVIDAARAEGSSHG